MDTTDDNDFELFRNNHLFRGFGEKEIKTLYGISKEVPLERGDILIHEGEKGEDLFIIIKGTLEVTKYDPEEKDTYVIDTLVAGDSVGEIAFIDRGVRSASVRAQTEAVVRSISFQALEDLVKKSTEFSEIYIHLSKHISQRLRSTSNMALESLKKEVRENRTRVNMGLFLIEIITVLCLFAYSLDGLQYLISVVPNTSYVALPLTLLMGVFLLVMMKYSKLSWKEFGLTLSNWKRAVFEGIVFPIPILGFGVFIKWAVIHLHPAYAGRALFEPFAAFTDPAQRTWGYWIAFNAIYWFFIVPIQELLTRGGLQGLLEHFLTGKHRVLISILISNLIFSTVHVFFALHFGLIVFFGGLFIGWIYSRTHNLISSSIAHAVLGTWALSVLGAVLTTTQ
jgi:CRP-like cAMP-binding protein